MSAQNRKKPWEVFYPKEIPFEIDIPVHPVFQLLTDTAWKSPDAVAFQYQDRLYTYGEVKDRVDRLSAALSRLGLQKGDRVAIMFPNCPEYGFSYYAILQAGGTVVQVNPHLTEYELSYLLDDSGAEWMMLGVETFEKHLEMLESRKCRCVVFGVSEESPFFQSPHIYSADALISATPPEPPAIVIDPLEDVAVLQYTGGTTGRSKGVMLTHYNLVANAYQSYAGNSPLLDNGAEVVLGTSPLYHVYGMTSCLNVTVLMGSKLILLPRFDRDEVMELIRRFRPTLFPGVPTMYISILNHPLIGETDMTSLKICNCGSSPMPVEVMKQFEDRTGARIIEGYGLSETAPVTHRNPVLGLRKVGSIGIPIPNTDAKIVDLETGERELPPGEAGELIVYGPQVMKGYWNNEGESKAVLRNGWLYTGDIATMDEDGYFYIVGRKKDLIITGGLNVYPKEIEEVLYQHVQVQEVVVAGIPDSYRGESVVAFVVRKPGTSVTAEELQSWCRQRLVAYKVPRHIEFRNTLPKTAVGKVLRRLLQSEIAQDGLVKDHQSGE